MSLTNSICKIFEKVINNRIKSVLSLAEAQAGARERRSSVDQLLTLKLVIQQKKFQRKQTYITLIDIEKAFDYTWREGMFYNLCQRGVRGKNIESNVQFMPRSIHYNKHETWTNKRN